ncbi:MAG: uroporphyrinogen decarboxylase family protein [Prevotella sp.]
MKKNILRNGALAIAALLLTSSVANAQSLPNKRELIYQVLDQSRPNDYVPAAFFLHFKDKLGLKAVQEHVEFFKATNMDIVKIQYEIVVPHIDIKKPEDWKKVPVYDKEFFAPQIEVIEAISGQLQGQALVFPTVYSPLALLSQTVGREDIIDLIKKDPEAVKPALENISKSIINYLDAAREHGADGFYVSSQGGDLRTFGGTKAWDIIRPYDKSISEHAHKIAPINILHVCDYGSSYKDQATLEGYADYPTSIINPPVNLEKGFVDLKHLQKVFNRPVFGGLDRLGVLVKGTIDEAKKEVDRILENAPDNFILGADCTVPSETDYVRLREIIDYAHNWRKTHKK